MSSVAASFLHFPMTVGGSGSLELSASDDHLRELILQVLFTEPGERVNLPDFGCGVRRLVFAPNNDMLRATTEFLITHNLQRWLGDRLDSVAVSVTSNPGEEEALYVDITYVPKSGSGPKTLRASL